MFGSPPPRTMNEPITEARAMPTIAPSRIKIPPIRDNTNAVVGFSAIANSPYILRVVSKFHYKSIVDTVRGERLSGPHTLSGVTPCTRGDSPMVQGYCVKCRAKREIKNPIAVKRASGSIVEDVDGNFLIDFASGISVLNVGHAHPKVVEAISRQAEQFTHFAGTDFYYEIQTTLADRLGKITPGKHRKKVFFGNSGTEANEAAIKVAKSHTKRQMFLAFLGAFHGRTQGALSLTASKAKQRAGFFPTMPGVVHVPYAYCYRCPYKLTYPSCDLYCANIIEDVYMKTVAPPEDTAGVFVEPVQGEGGYIVPPPGWMDRIAKIAKDHGALLIDDEVQSGLGRTGKMWAIEHSDAVPDILTMAKSLGGGLPIGAAVYPAEMDFRESGN